MTPRDADTAGGRESRSDREASPRPPGARQSGPARATLKSAAAGADPSLQTLQPRPAMSDVCMVRQPVFSKDGSLLSYEIRFRDTPDGFAAFLESLRQGTFDSMRKGLPAFVPLTPAQFLGEVLAIADPTTLTPIFPAWTAPDPALLDGIARYCAAGGRIALDQRAEEDDASAELLPLADWVRIDARLADAGTIARIVDRVRVRPDTLVIADHVYEAPQLELARALGFDAFEGAHLSRHEPMPAAQLPASTISALRLLSLARDPNVSDTELEHHIGIDPVLTFQLLRIVNSAYTGSRGVTSIAHALRLIGRNAFLRWLALAIAASRRGGSGVDQQLVRQAVERARLCEQLVGGGRDAGTLFLVGLFSLLDAVFHVSLEELLQRVALTQEVSDALLERSGPYAPALEFTEMYELGLFESAAEVAQGMGLDPARIGQLYEGALTWADQMLAAA
jgi:EAL and modified HD-GYP domain-containing signal transduction protein